MNERIPHDGLGLGSSFAAAARPILTVDVAKYQKYLDETDLSAAEKDEFIRNLWAIVVAFVELGFGVHPLQEVCGQFGQDCPNPTKTGPDSLESDHEATSDTPMDSGPPGRKGAG